ncbi:MAG: hypothetical protein SOU07_05760 [Bacilli bacterium]|nr:hypothetical protein [Bacilli bacterium]
MENKIGKRYEKLTVIKKIDRRKHETSAYLWKCDCGNDRIASTSCLVSGTVTSCGCKNEKNKTNIRSIDKGLVDCTRISAISKSRKISNNNTSEYIGVSYSKEKKEVGYADYFYKERIILFEDLTQNVKIFKL